VVSEGKNCAARIFLGGVILHAESGELRAASFEPIVRAAVELHEFAEPRGAQRALTMSGSTTLARRPETVLAQQTAQCFATEREALALDQFLAQMVVIEARMVVRDSCTIRSRTASGSRR